MASPLEQLNQASYRGGRRGGVAYRLPPRIPPRRAAPPPERIGTRDRPQDTASRWLTPNFEGIANFKPPVAQAQGGGGGLGGLGGLLSGAGKLGMGALTVLDYPRSAVNAVISEAVPELIQRMPDAGNYPTLDTNFSWQDMWENFKEHKGFGETLVEPIMGPEGDDWGIWPRRLMGLAGDIAMDPFTYVNPALGVGADIGKANRFKYLNELADAQDAAKVAEKTALDAAFEAFGQAPMGTDWAGVAAGRQAAEQAAARGAELGGEQALSTMAQRGLNIAPDAQLEAMKLGPHGLRLGGPQGMVVPGTEALSRRVTGALAPVKGAISGSAVARGARGLRTPKGYIGQDLTQAMERLMTGKGNATARAALRAFAIDESMREAGGTFAALGTQALERVDEATHEMGSAQRAELIRQAEEQGAKNEFTGIAEMMREAAKEAGGDIPAMTPITLPDGTVIEYVMPHVLSREAFNFLNKLKKGQDPLVDRFKVELGITDKSLREEGGFLLQRELKPNPDGTPKEIKFGENLSIQIERGSVAEKNEKLGALLRDHGFEGEVYETNPIEAWRRYVQATRRDVADRAAYNKAIERGFEGIYRDPGKPKGWDPYGGRIEMAPAEEGGVPRYRVAPNKRARPEDTEFYEFQPDIKASNKRNAKLSMTKKGIGGEQREILADYNITGEARRREIAAEVDATANDVWGTIKDEKLELRQQSEQAVTDMREAASVYDQRVDQLGELQTRLDDNYREIRRLDRSVKRIERTAAERTQERQREVLDKLRGQLDEAQRREAALQAEYVTARNEVEAAELRTRGAIRDLRENTLGSQERKLNRRLQSAQSNYDRIRTAAERSRKALARRDKERWISKATYDEAVERAERGGLTADYRALIAERDRLIQRRTELNQTIEDTFKRKNELDKLLKQRVKAQPPGVDWQTKPGLRRMADELLEAQRAYDDAVRQLENVEKGMRAIPKQIRESEAVKVLDTIRAYRDQQKRLEGFHMDMDVFNPETGKMEVRSVNMGAAKQVLDDAEADLSAWERAKARDVAERGAPRPPEPEPVRLPPEDQARLDAAEKFLDTPRAKRVQRQQARTNRERLEYQQATQETRDKITQLETEKIPFRPTAGVEVGRREGKQAKAIRLHNAQVDEQLTALRKELSDLAVDESEANQWLRNNARLAQRVDEAVATRTQMRQQLTEAESAAAAARPQQASDLPYHDVFQGLQRQEQQMMGALGNQGQQLRRVEEAYEPALETAAGNVEAARGSLGQGEKYVTGEAISEATEAMRATGAARGTQETLRSEREGLFELRDQVDEAAGGALNKYSTALQNNTEARQTHEQIMEAMEGLHKPRSATEMIESTKRGAVPGRSAMADVPDVATARQAATGQPLYQAVDDINKVIAVNPTGNDPLMLRAEAALQAEEQSLAELTRQVDKPRAQLTGILADARNGKLAPVIKAQMRSNIESVWEHGDVLIRKDVASLYRSIAETVDSKWFGRNMTFLTNFFKTWATLSPGFHVRNALSAIFMNGSEGVAGHEMNRAYRLWREFATADDPVAFFRGLADNEREAFRATFASGAGGQFFERGVSELRTGATRRKEVLFSNKLTRASQKFGRDWVEGPQRLALGLHYTNQGKGVQGALNAISRVHFDYSQVSKFDENMKRFIPFWTFMSRNLPLQIQQMWTKPRAYRMYQAFARNFAGPGPELMPEYIGQAGGFQIGELETPNIEIMGKTILPGGMPVVAQPDLPFLRLQDDISRVAGALSGDNPAQVLSDFNPYLTAPLEYALGQDFFTGKRYDENDWSQASGIGLPLAAALAPLGAARRGADGNWYLKDSALASLKAMIPPLERTSRLVPESIATSGQPNDRLVESWARFMGVPMRTISQSQMESEAANRFYRGRDQARLQAATGG